jgi:hypothetical protein
MVQSLSVVSGLLICGSQAVNIPICINDLDCGLPDCDAAGDRIVMPQVTTTTKNCLQSTGVILHVDQYLLL